MIPAADIVAEKPRAPKRSWPWLLALLLILLAGSALFLPLFSSRPEAAPLTRSLDHLKQIGQACRLYAMDHQGDFPESLAQLDPDYLSAVALKERRFRDPQTRRVFDWLYFPGFQAESPPETIILASPKPTAKGRLVVYADIRGDFIEDEAFRRQLAQQGSR